MTNGSNEGNQLSMRDISAKTQATSIPAPIQQPIPTVYSHDRSPHFQPYPVQQHFLPYPNVAYPHEMGFIVPSHPILQDNQAKPTQESNQLQINSKSSA